MEKTNDLIVINEGIVKINIVKEEFVYDIDEIISNSYLIKDIIYKIGDDLDLINDNVVEKQKGNIIIFDERIIFQTSENRKVFNLGDINNPEDVVKIISTISKFFQN